MCTVLSNQEVFHWPVKGTPIKTISIHLAWQNPIISLRPSFQQFADEHLPETTLDRNLAAVKRPRLWINTICPVINVSMEFRSRNVRINVKHDSGQQLRIFRLNKSPGTRSNLTKSRRWRMCLKIRLEKLYKVSWSYAAITVYWPIGRSIM